MCCLTAYLHHMNLFETITQAMRPNLTRSCWEICTTSTTTTGTCGSCSSCSPSAPGWRRPSASSRYSTRSSWDRWNVSLNISLLMQKFREGLIPHITLADRKGNGVLVVKWQVIFLFQFKMYNCTSTRENQQLPGPVHTECLAIYHLSFLRKSMFRSLSPR